MEKICKKIVTMFFIAIVRATKTILVVPHGTCRFYPSCSRYAEEALATLPLHLAFFYIVRRVLKCNPFIPAGYDPVPRTKERYQHCE
jgi:uncharacterized protein